jgi:glycerate 2-kinase
VLHLAEEAGEGDVLLVLISGGGSALLPLPAPPLSLADKLAATKVGSYVPPAPPRTLLARRLTRRAPLRGQALAHAGASIAELNTVRKHLSASEFPPPPPLPFPIRVLLPYPSTSPFSAAADSAAVAHRARAVRRAAVKGGRLAAAAFPARVEALVLSDVVGDPLSVIASGPRPPAPRAS